VELPSKKGYASGKSTICLSPARCQRFTVPCTFVRTERHSYDLPVYQPSGLLPSRASGNRVGAYLRQAAICPCHICYGPYVRDICLKGCEIMPQGDWRCLAFRALHRGRETDPGSAGW
jgi:hypothetical protein